MTSADWNVATKVDPKQLGDARVLTQNGVHWLARIANSYLDGEPRGRQLLTYDADRHAFCTTVFAHEITTELRLPSLELQFLEGGQPVPHILDVEGRSPAQVEAWVLVELLHRGIDRDRFSKGLPYDTENLMTGDSVEFSPESFADQLGDLSLWFANAHQCLSSLAGVHGLPSSQRLMCWPDQLQIGFVLATNPGEPASDRAIRVAMSAGDGRTAEPHFLVATQTDGQLRTAYPGTLITASRILSDKMSCADVAAILEGMIAATRKRMAS